MSDDVQTPIEAQAPAAADPVATAEVQAQDEGNAQQAPETAEASQVADASTEATETAPTGDAPAAEPVAPIGFAGGSVEQRLADLEAKLLALPKSIMHVMHQGSMEAEEFAARVVAHLLG